MKRIRKSTFTRITAVMTALIMLLPTAALPKVSASTGTPTAKSATVSTLEGLIQAIANAGNKESEKLTITLTTGISIDTPVEFDGPVKT